MDKSRKVLIITGTSRGIGKELVKFFLKKNFTVFGCSRKKNRFKHKNYFHSEVDISNANQVKKWLNEIVNKKKKIDFLINNASLTPASFPVLLNNKDYAEEVMKTNFIGVINVMNEVSKIMIKKKFGRIVNISSMALALLQDGTSLYSSSKSAMETYSKIFAKELSSSNITCNVVAPSMYDTSSFRELGKKVIENAKKKLQFKRLLTINEIGNAINFFFQEESGVITGQSLYLGLSR